MINYVSYDDSYTIHESLKLRIYRSLFHKVILFTTSLPYPPSPTPIRRPHWRDHPRNRISSPPPASLVDVKQTSSALMSAQGSRVLIVSLSYNYYVMVDFWITGGMTLDTSGSKGYIGTQESRVFLGKYLRGHPSPTRSLRCAVGSGRSLSKTRWIVPFQVAISLRHPLGYSTQNRTSTKSNARFQPGKNLPRAPPICDLYTYITYIII